MSRCVACRVALVGAAAEHGTYRLRASDCAVVACSPACASVGLVAAMIGMPLQKRSADAAELDVPGAKEIARTNKRESDRLRIERWLDILRQSMDAIRHHPDVQPTTHQVKGALLSIGAAVSLDVSTALAILGDVHRRMQQIHDDIVGMQPYSMQAALDTANNAVGSLTRMELMAGLGRSGALTRNRETYVDMLPADLQPLVAAYTHNRLAPAVKFELPEITVRAFGASYLYTRDDNANDYNNNIIDVWTLGGIKVNRLGMDTGSLRQAFYSDDPDYLLFEPPTARAGGELWALAPHTSGELYAGVRAMHLPADCTMLAAVDPSGRRAVAFSNYDAKTQLLTFKTFTISGRGLELDGVHQVPSFALLGTALQARDVPGGYDPENGRDISKIVQFVDNQIIIKLAMVYGDSDRMINTLIAIDLVAKTYQVIVVVNEIDDVEVYFVGRTHVVVTTPKILVIPRNEFRAPRGSYTGAPNAPSLVERYLYALDLSADDADERVEEYDVRTSLPNPTIFVGVNRFLAVGVDYEPDTTIDGVEFNRYNGYSAELYVMPY